MKNDTIYPRVPDSDERLVEYRPLGPGQDFQRVAPPIAASDRQAFANEPAVEVPKAPPIVAQAPIIQPVAAQQPILISQPQPQPLLGIEPTKPKPKKSFSVGYAVAIIAVLAILGIVGYVAYNTWQDAVAKEKAAQTALESTAVVGGAKDETEVTTAAIDSYSVAADLPKILTIDSIGVRSRIQPTGLASSDLLQAPDNIYDSGWYTNTAKPGDKGATVLNGYVTGTNQKGLFVNIDNLKVGDKLVVERGDGEKYSYAVMYKVTVKVSDVDMTKLLKPYEGTEEGVNLIINTGAWIPSQKTYDQRVLVYTKRI